MSRTGPSWPAIRLGSCATAATSEARGDGRRPTWRAGSPRSAARCREQAGDLLARCFEDGRFVDRPAAAAGPLAPAIRPWSDAIELAHLLTGEVPPGFDADDLARRLTALQDPATGLIPDGDISDRGLENPARYELERRPFDGTASYHILSVGYALRLLGRTFEHPISIVHSLSDRDLVAALEARDWGAHAWGSGAAVDAIGTACAINIRDFGHRFDDGGVGPLYGLMGWLNARSNETTGMWGARQHDTGWLQAGQRVLPAHPRHLRPVRPAAPVPRGQHRHRPRARGRPVPRDRRRLHRVQHPRHHPPALAGGEADRARPRARARPGRARSSTARWSTGSTARGSRSRPRSRGPGCRARPAGHRDVAHHRVAARRLPRCLRGARLSAGGRAQPRPAGQHRAGRRGADAGGSAC